MTTGTTGVISMCEQPIPAQGTRQVPQTDAPVRAVRTRRVGTFTCGVALVLTGLAIGIYLIWPRFDLLFFFRLCPLLLVLLGGELLAASFSRSELRIKYDFVSMVLCLVIGVAALVLSIIPVAVRWISPDHLAVQQQITAKADEEIYRLLSARTDAQERLAGMRLSQEQDAVGKELSDFFLANRRLPTASVAPTEISPLISTFRSTKLCSSRSASSTISSALCRKKIPSSVSVSPFFPLIISVVPSSLSRSMIWRLSEGCVICRISAAFVMFSSSAAVKK